MRENEMNDFTDEQLKRIEAAGKAIVGRTGTHDYTALDLITELTRPQPEFREGQVVRYQDPDPHSGYIKWPPQHKQTYRTYHALTPEEVGPGYVPVEDVESRKIARLESMLDRLAEGDFPDYGIGHDPAKWQSDEIRLSREYAASHRSEDDE